MDTSRVKLIISKEGTPGVLENVFLKIAFLKFATCQNSWKIHMYKIIFSKVADYQPINMYFFIRIVRGFASFGRPIFQNSSEWLLLLFSNQLFKSDLFRQTVCVFILVNISNIINTSLCNAVYYKETVHSICLLHHLVGFYIITSTAT